MNYGGLNSRGGSAIFQGPGWKEKVTRGLFAKKTAQIWAISDLTEAVASPCHCRVGPCCAGAAWRG